MNGARLKTRFTSPEIAASLNLLHKRSPYNGAVLFQGRRKRHAYQVAPKPPIAKTMKAGPHADAA
jgi:hypothetical protein